VLFPLSQVLFPLSQVLFPHILDIKWPGLDLKQGQPEPRLLARVPEVYPHILTVIHRFEQECTSP